MILDGILTNFLQKTCPMEKINVVPNPMEKTNVVRQVNRMWLIM